MKLNKWIFKTEDEPDNKEPDNKEPDNKEPDKKEPTPTPEDYEKKLQAEVDRRVTEALKKQEKKLKDAQAEKERQAKLSEEERQKELSAKIAQEQAEKDRALTIKELKLDLIDVLNDKQMDLGFRDLIDVSSLTDVAPEDRADELKSKVDGVKKIFDLIVEKKVAEIKAEYLKGHTPEHLHDKDKKTPPTAYEQARDRRDIKAMLQAKLDANRVK